MNDTLLQEKRVAKLTTPLGADKLALTRFEGFEGLSELFEFRIDALSKDGNLDFDQALGRSCGVAVSMYADPKRYFEGILVEAQTLGMAHDLYSYRLVLRPSLWLLSRTTNCRIWHEKTALEIIKELLSAGGVDHRAVVSRDCRKREYCVQYRETDLAFVSRLMEDEGIYYFFEHSEGSHMMVLADAKSSHKPIPGHESLRFSTASAAGHTREEALFEWSQERRFRSGKFELRDYNFKTPGNKLKGNAQAQGGYQKSDLEIYDYPGKYDVESEGKAYAELRRDAEQAVDQRRYGAGEAPSLFPGGLVTLKEHPKASENRSLLVLRATHHFTAQTYRSSGSSPGGGDSYRGNYEFLLATRVFRAPVVTPKPIVYGPQTAKVVCRPNGDGEEIDTDEHGRIRVRFHWDREDKRSCWVRVAQMWSGKKWGGQFIPRVDMEVVVEFLEGDPDRPLIVGCVYNNDNKYPWTLPDHKTQSGIKSNSSKGGGGENHLRLEDLAGKEQIEMHAQKFHDVIVLDRETWTIGKAFSGEASQESIYAGSVPESRFATLVHGDDRLHVQDGNQKIEIKKNRDTTINQGNDKLLIEQGNQTVTISQGNQTTEVTAGKILIKAGQEIKLQVGSSTITIDNSGITIKAPQITQKADATMETSAGAIMTIKAAMIMIN